MTAAVLHLFSILYSQIAGYVAGGMLTMLHSDGANKVPMAGNLGIQWEIPLDCDRINARCTCIRDALMS